MIPVEVADPRRRHAGIRERRRRLDRHELRRAEAPARADRDLWRPRAASWCRTPTASAARCRWRKPGGEWETMPLTPRPCRRRTSARSASPTWRPRSSTGRPHRASGALALHVLEVMEAFQTSADEGRRVEHRKPRRAARHDAGGPADRTDRLRDGDEHAQGNDRLGRLAGARPRSVRLDRSAAG